jgi:hypothetical protein
MSDWDWGRLTHFLEAVMGSAEQLRDWMQTQDCKAPDSSELFRRWDQLAHEMEAAKRLVKRFRSTSRG